MTDADIAEYIPNIDSSLINFESPNLKGDIGLTGYTLEKVFRDDIVVDMVDAEDGLIKQGEFFMSANTDTKAWRRAKVIMVGPLVKNYKVGDMVIFPGINGLETGVIDVRQEDGSLYHAKNGKFLSEYRIFGIISQK